MFNTFRPGTRLLVLVVVLSGAALSWAGWSRTARPPRSRRWSARSSQELPENIRVAQQRADAKNQAVDHLLAGELNLLEAAAWFRFLNDNPSEYPVEFRDFTPGHSDGEKACRQVIEWVANRLRSQGMPSQVRPVLKRLQEELNALLDHSGVIELPW